MRKLIMILACVVASVGLSVAQTTQVSGTVLDDTGETVIGASVVAKGTTTGTITDLDGNFTLDIPSDKKTLVISLIGYKPKEVAAGKGIKVIMEPDSKLIDEVVVTGYGNVKKASFTGAATVISTSKLENVPSVSLSSRLAGSASGVSVGSSTGQPGAVESLRIRGTGSANASNEPLYVVDGVPMNTGNANQFDYSQSGNSILSTINANDIESISIIKDAAAASLYGSRAANGVVVITTKSGKAGKTLVTLRADWGFSNMAIDYRPTLNGDQRRELQYQGLINYYNNNNKNPEEAKAIEYANSQIDKYAQKPETGWEDWKDLLFRTGTQQNYEVNLQGGNDKTTFYSSLSYTSTEGITYQSNLDRITGRLNVTHKATDKFTLNANVSITNTKQKVNNEGTSFASPIMAISMTASPQDYAYNPDGTYNITNKFLALGGNALANPLYNRELNYNNSELNKFSGLISADYKIADGLSVREKISYDFLQSNDKVWWDPRSNDGYASKGVYQRFMVNNKTLVSQTHLMYDKSFNKVHNLNALVGYEAEKYKLDYTYANGTNYPTFQKPEIINAGTTRSSSEYKERRMISYVGLVNYNYDNRYYFGASIRRDGSSKFSKDNRWGNFWSLSGSWRLTEEVFAQSFKNILTDAKVRLSYGTNGNLPIENYEYMDIYKFGYNYNGNPGSAPARMPYPNLTWEKNKQLNFGLDLTLIERFNVTFDVYSRKSKDLLLNKSISQTTGFDQIMMNVGEMTNKGFELSITSTNIAKKDFLWTTTLNLAHNQNKLTSIGGGTEFQRSNVSAQSRLIHRVGESFNSLYAYEYAGVDPNTGKEMYYKNTPGAERETTTNSAEAKMVIIGKVDPNLQGGITNNLSYKDFDLGFTFTFTLGGHLYDNLSWVNSNGGTYNYNGNIPAYYNINDMWQKPGDNARLPQFVQGNTYTPSSRWMYSSDHLRLKNITFGYTLPKKALESLRLSKARVYASAVNLFTIKPGNLYLDPEAPVNPDPNKVAAGVVTAETPSLRSVTFGIEISF